MSRPYRRTGIGAALVLVALAVTWAATGAAATVADPGQGTAIAQVMRVDPKAGALSIGIGVGEALAGHQNLAAKAQSLSLDLGVIGTSLTTAGCGSPPTFQPSQLPQMLIVENGQPHASTGITQTQEGGVFTQFGQATDGPFAKAVTTVTPVSVPGLLSIAGGTATSWSGIVNGHRTAGATVDITGISLLGKVTLSSLHWEVSHQTTGGDVHAGKFTVGGVTIAGVALPTVDVVSVLAQVNGALKTLGLQIQPPRVHLTQGIEYVDPLQIAVVPNATRDKLLSTILSGIQPVRQPLFDAVLKQVCKASTPIEVADIAIGAVSGAGSFDIQLGGLQAGTGEVARNSFDLGLPGSGSLSGPSLLGPTVDSSTGSVVSSPPATARPVALTPVTVPAASTPVQQAVRPIISLHGKRGGALAAVGLGGLAILALLAEGDRRMMRRAQRKASFED